jgi:hypothetical protein
LIDYFIYTWKEWKDGRIIMVTNNNDNVQVQISANEERERKKEKKYTQVLKFLNGRYT